MKTWDKFLKDVLPKVSGCPEVLAEHAIKRAAQEFFDTTRVWRLWLPAITTADQITDYALPLESRAELVRLETATLDGCEINVLAAEDLPRDWKTYPDTMAACVHTTDRKTIVLLPRPAADRTLLVEASMRPAEDSLGIEDDLFSLFVLPIAHGAIAILKEDIGTSYADAGGATYWRGQFNDAMVSHEFRRSQGYSSQRRPRRARFM